MEKNLKKLPHLNLKIDNIRAHIRKFLPKSPGIYIFSVENTIIYIGKANSLVNRVLNYFGPNLETKTKTMVGIARSLSFIKVNSEFEALLLEAALIRKYQPQYNIISKDDKHALYIQITDDEFPRVIAVRKPITNNRSPITIFGPFPNSTNVARVLKTLRRIFPYSDHGAVSGKLGKRGCIYSHIGLCNPCPNEIVNSTKYLVLRKIYLKNIRRIKSILSGKIDSIKNELIREMRILSKNENYEDALEVKRHLEKLEYITSPRIDAEMFMENPNLYEDQRKLEIKELKKLLVNCKLKIENCTRIECYDIAHLSGTFPTASMVTFINAEADKSLYRHFKINPKTGGNDYGSMKEVARRRMRHFADWGTPNLIIVDGGLGQVKSFTSILYSNVVKIPVVGIAKNPDRLIIGDQKIKLQGAVLQLISRMRDEAHRFSRHLHHKLLVKSLIPKKP
ncbi:MAG: GIY-YIG nuclease family protein [Patescibacteria group bacterium]|mgnify:FL=1